MRPSGAHGEETQVLDQGRQANWAVLKDGIYFINANTGLLQFYRFADRKLETLDVPLYFPRIGATWAGLSWPKLSVSQDHRYILYAQWDQAQSDIMLVENFQ